MTTFDDSSLPKQFGSYLLKQKIARGGMAELYLAEMRGPGGFVKPMVIKMVHSHFSKDERFLSMFTDEAKILSGLSHGNIVPVFDFGNIEGIFYLAMEFIDGADVATLIDMCRVNGIAIPLDVTLWIGIGVAAGLSHVHQALDSKGQSLDVVHRDISPQNILTSRSGEVKLCDFGIAVSAIREGDTDSGMIKGKLLYFSPEQARSDDIDAKSDIFSLGVVLYELITGHHPVPSGADVSVLRALSDDNGYLPLGEAAPWIPPAVAQAVDRTMAFRPKDRQDTAEDLRNELSRVLHAEFPDFTPKHLGDLVAAVQTLTEESDAQDLNSKIRAQLASFASAARESTAQGMRRKALRTDSKRRPWRIAAMIGLVVVLAIGLAFVFVRSGEAKKETTSATVENVAEKEATHSTAPTDIKPDSVGEKLPAANPSGSGSDSGPQLVVSKKPKMDTASRSKRRAHGLFDANASPWAEVSVDGVRRGTTPIIGLKLPTGRHRATFVNPELGVTRKKTFVVKQGETTRLIVEMD
ncbi:MAG: serine/threonine protein kinase [Proteobacteria bacterium]|nr:serine/threonine protein kinase [Pseudomonadota bacterium]